MVASVELLDGQTGAVVLARRGLTVGDVQQAIAVYSSDELDIDEGGEAENNVRLKNWLEEGRKQLDEARQALSYLCEPVALPREVEQYLHYFCGDAASSTALAETEPLLREANAVTDNPLVFAEDGMLISGGNFHAEPVGFAADMIAMALAEIGAIAQRQQGQFGGNLNTISTFSF